MAFDLYRSVIDTGLAANRPTTPDYSTSLRRPCFFYATDTLQLSMYDFTNAAWRNVGAAAPVTALATYAVPVAPNQTVYLSAVAGFTSTLPAATGSGNVVEFVVKTTLTSGAYAIAVTGSDTIGGTIIASKTTTATPYYATPGTTVAITLTFTTVGAGIKGDRIRLKDVASGVWEVDGNTWVSGTVATPFS